MKFFLVLALVGVAACGRLENNYLPPTHAASSGGSAGALQAPYAGAASNSGSRFSGSAGFGSGSGSRFGGGAASGSSSGSGFVGGAASGFGGGATSGYSGGASSGYSGSASSGFGGGATSGYSGSASSGYSGGAASGGRQQPPPAILKYSNDNNGEGTYQYSFETENGISQQESGSLKNAGTDSETNVVTGSYSYTDANGQLITVNYIADENGFRAEGAHLPTPPPIPAAIQRALEQNAAEEAAASRGTGGQNGYPSGAASNNNNNYNKPNNAYIPPVQAARRPGFNQQSGYNY